MRAILAGLSGEARWATATGAAVFVLALATGQEAALAPLYLVPLCLVARSDSRRLILRVGAGVSALALLGVALAPAGSGSASGLLGLFATWSAIALVSWYFLGHMRTTLALRGREANLQSITDAVPGAVFQYESAADGTAGFTFVSRGVMALVDGDPDYGNVSLEYLLGHVVPEDLPELQRSIAMAVSTRSEWSHEFRVATQSGNQKWLSGRSAPEPQAGDGTLRFNGLIVDVTERVMAETALEHQARHDHLTGLFNRRDFEQRVAEVLATGSTMDAEHVLAYVDLDQFKVINDTCGHIAGDELLRQLARLIETQLRRSDTLARLGGDEFGILMERCSMPQAQVVMERLRQRVAEFRYAWEDKTFKLGISIGLVPVGADVNDISEVFRRADAACYAAKDAGRNRIHCYHEGDADLARRRGEMQWVSRITQALERNEFELYAQPIVSTGASGGHGVHYEILIRLREADGSIVAPGAFLPAAERYNLSPQIDRWVMRTAFAWLASHPASLAELNMCCINLSALTLCDDDSRDYIIEQFMQSGVPPSKICFEVTETAAIANLERATVFIHALKALGCRFALDDFGSGLSSFAYLKNLPVDYLKIDGIFVRDMLDDAMDLAIVRSINEVGHAMGMLTIGEFVENDAILRRLAEVGVDFAQGYGVGRPRPLAELPQMAAATVTGGYGVRANVGTRQVA